MSFTSDEHDGSRLTPAVIWLIGGNLAIAFLQVALFDPADVRGWLGVPSLSSLISQPWTVVTYMFVHQGLLQLALNVYALWLFGPRVEEAWKTSSFVYYYLLCGMAGWAAHVIFVRTGTLVGASAAVFGVMLAYAMRWPDEEVALFGVMPMRVRWLVTLLIGMNLAAGVWDASQIGEPGATQLAHLGGLAFAFMYLRTTSGSIERLRQRMSQVPDITDEPPRAIPRTHPRRSDQRDRDRDRERGQEIDEIVARSNAMVAKRPSGVPTLARKPVERPSDELDLVLDKISEQGLESLTRDERKLLEEFSRKLRGS
jgi:membrane associated rhomboid family serine protease